jgi:aminopeptidase N/puromycin-sensitive aminopeptidase
VCLRTPSGEARCEIMDRRRQAVRLDGCERAPAAGSGSANLVVANADSRGYYFSQYTPDGVRGLAAASSRLEPVERLRLIGDEWWMVRAGRHDVGTYLDMAGAFANDETAAVADSLADRLAVIGEDLVTAADRPAYEAWIRARFGPQLATLGLPGEARDSDELQSRRATLLALVGVAGADAAVQKRARELAEQYLKDPRALPATIAPTVLRVAAVSGDRALYDQYVAQLEKLTSQPELYYRIFGALAWFGDPALVRRTLDFALSPAVRTQDTGGLIGNLMVRPASQEMAWEFVQRNWDTIVRTLGEFQGIPEIVQSLGAFCSSARAAEVRSFFETHRIPSSQRSVAQAVERIDACAALVDRQAKPLSAWLGEVAVGSRQ